MLLAQHSIIYITVVLHAAAQTRDGFTTYPIGHRCLSRGGFTKPSLGLVVGRGDGDDGPRTQSSSNLETLVVLLACTSLARAR